MPLKKPMEYNPTLASSATSQQDKWASEMGFDSDEAGEDEDWSDDEDREEEEEDEEEDEGISFVEYLSLQKSLKRTNDERIQLKNELKIVKDDLRQSKRDLDKLGNNARVQRGILERAQKTQIEEKDALIDSLKITIEEIDKNGQVSQGVSQMAESINSLSNDKREWFEKAEKAELKIQELESDLKFAREDLATKVAEFEQERKDLQDQLDPVKMAQASQVGAVNVNSEEVETLRKENAKLRSELREAQDTSAPSSSASQGEVDKFKKDLNELRRKNQQLQDELKQSKANSARLEALNASDADASEAHKLAVSSLQSQLEEAQAKARDATSQSETLQDDLSQEKSKAARLDAELQSLKAAMDAQLEELQKTGGEQKSVEAQLQARVQELTAERSAHEAERAAHEETKNQLHASKKSLADLKSSIEANESKFNSDLKAERDRATTALQKAKADAAAQLAEAKQRAEDDMKELNERLATFGGVVKPMYETLQMLSKNYKALRKETRDLQGEIEPVVKQCKRSLLRTLADVDKQYKEMLRKYRKEMALRKKLHNQLVDLKGNIRVFGRVRPIISEDGKSDKIVVQPDPADDQMLMVKNKGKTSRFELDHIFSPESTQESVFDEAKDVIISVIDGFNVCIFAYGQTGSGKTFTMEGSDDNPGLNRRALSHLFETVEEKKSDWSYEIEVSVMEIYNEQLRDLLSDNPKSKLKIRHGASGPEVPGLSKHRVESAEEVRSYFKRAQKSRATSATDMNERSSRSHALLVVYVTGTNLSTGVQTIGKLNLIDLAGSERVSKSGAIDDAERFDEAKNINKSLSCLGDVINALGKKQKHVPYRNSTLTHLLQDSLGGHAKTVMVVQVSPVDKNVGESVCSLNFATRVRSVELGAAKKSTQSAEVTALKKRIKELESA